ncbi:18761_t:CDS:1, partial [Gigaspora rosea]
MKLSSYPYKLVGQYLFLTSLCILITLVKSETTSFNYTENTSGTTYPLSAPQVVSVQTYDDGTILVSIARIARHTDSTIKKNPTQTYNCTGQSLEQVLRLRAIQLDGSIKEIDSHLNLDPLNY